MVDSKSGLIMGGGLSLFICCCCIISSVVIAILYYNGAFTDEEEEKKDKDDDLPLVTPPSGTSSGTSSGIPSGTNTTQKEVFHIMGYEYTYPSASEECKKFNNSELATQEQLIEAQKAGAHWWSGGWIKEKDGQRLAQYPMSTNEAGVPAGVLTYLTANTEDSTAKAGINCYGQKPSNTEEYIKKIAPFNSKIPKWFQQRDISNNLQRPQIADPGYPDDDPILNQQTTKPKRGWYDLNYSGVKNNYCRFVGDATQGIHWSCIKASNPSNPDDRSIPVTDWRFRNPALFTNL
jgi:hypothetical protein